jgi:YggT family protein
MSKIYEALSIITDPIEEPIRQVQYRYVSLPIDFSPLIAILLIQLIQRLIFIIFW